MSKVIPLLTLFGFLTSSVVFLSGIQNYSSSQQLQSTALSAGDAPWAFQNQNQQNTGYSPQTLISSSNVASLILKWSTAIGGLTGTPVVSNGVVYVTSLLPLSQTKSSIYAVSESTGKIMWIDGPAHATKLTFSTSVGVTIDSGSVFAGTSNNLLVRLNALTGAVQWKSNILKGTTGLTGKMYQGAEATPLIYNGLVIVGETFGDGNPGVRGFVRAFNEKTGSLAWTFYTVPPSPMTSSNQSPYKNSWGTNGTTGCTCGGGAVWGVPALDPSTGIIYFGTGNPSPGKTGVNVRTPVYPSSTYTNLYSDSIVALNAKTGALVWYFQEVPGDQHDYDAGMPVQLFTTTIAGTQTEVVGSGNKIGYYFVVNAHTGAMIYKVKEGIHENENSTFGAVPPSQIYPGGEGGINTFSSYDPMTNMIYSVAFTGPESCTNFAVCAGFNSTLYAVDASSGSIKWTMNLQGPGVGGGVSSTNNLLFASDGNHNFYALNALTGNILWTKHDSTGGMSGFGLWTWGAPAVTNGVVFETTYGVSSTSTGLLEAYIP